MKTVGIVRIWRYPLTAIAVALLACVSTAFGDGPTPHEPFDPLGEVNTTDAMAELLRIDELPEGRFIAGFGLPVDALTSDGFDDAQRELRGANELLYRWGRADSGESLQLRVWIEQESVERARRKLAGDPFSASGAVDWFVGPSELGDRSIYCRDLDRGEIAWVCWVHSNIRLHLNIYDSEHQLDYVLVLAQTIDDWLGEQPTYETLAESGALPVIEQFEPLEDAVVGEYSEFAVAYHDPQGRELDGSNDLSNGNFEMPTNADPLPEGRRYFYADRAGTCTGWLRIHNDLGLWAEATVEFEVHPRPQDDDEDPCDDDDDDEDEDEEDED